MEGRHTVTREFFSDKIKSVEQKKKSDKPQTPNPNQNTLYPLSRS